MGMRRNCKGKYINGILRASNYYKCMKEDINVEHLAHLARIELSDAQKAQLQKDLPAILDFVGQLDEVGVSHAEAGRQLLGLENVFRSDAKKDNSLPEGQKIIDDTPTTRDGFAEVPGVFNADK